MQTKELIDNFLAKEIEQAPRISRFLGHLPEIEPTAALSRDLKRTQITGEKIIHPSWIYRLIITFFLLVDLMFIIIVIRLMVDHKLPYLVLSGFILFLLFILFVGLYFGFIDKRRNYKIRMNREWIQLSGPRLYWTNIAETLIMTLPSRRRAQTYLVILTQDNTFYKFDLFNFAISDTRLSSLIEFYKNRN